MISWIQTTLQKHLKVFMVLLLIAVIIPFVFTIGATPGLGTADRSGKTIELFGTPFTTDADRQEFFTDAQLSYFLSSGQPFFDSSRVQMYAFQRAAALQLADRLGVPKANQEQIREHVRTMPAFAGENGAYDPDAYTRFRDEMATNPQIGQARVTRVLNEDWRAAQVNKAIGGPGYVLSAEVRQALARADTVWTMHTATLDLAKVPAPAEPSEAELKEWFEQNAARYRIPERMKVGYVEFSAAAFLPRVQLTDAEIEAHFTANKPRYAPPPAPVKEGEPPAPPAEPVLADVRDRVAQELMTTRARSMAAKAAADFAYILFDRKITPGSEAFDGLLRAQGLTLLSVGAFTATEPPPGSGWTSAVLTEAFRLNENRRVSDPLQVGADTIVLFHEERIPAADADFFAVRDKVAADVREDRRRAAITREGEAVRARLAAALQTGASVADVAGQAGLAHRVWEDFTLRNLPQEIDYSALGRIEELSLGEVSPMAVQGEQGVFTIVSRRQTPTVADSGEAFEAARTSMMRQGAMVTAQGLLGEIVERELVATGLASREN